MKHNTTQSYRTPSQTPQSRSVRFTPHSSKGFTLIELLVVISIIALLSTIVFASLSDARAKARNSAKNSLVLEYVKALELYRGNNESYPSAGTGFETTSKCVGYAESGDNCFGNEFSGSNAINNAFATYMSDNFSHRGSVMYGNIDLKGIQYKCKDNTCTEYLLIWMLEKNMSDCISNSRKTDDFYENTHCSYPK